MKQVLNRLHQMNYILPVFPGTDNVSLQDQELTDIVMFMMPNEWKSDLLKQNFDHYGRGLQEVQNQLEQLELAEQSERALTESRKTQRESLSGIEPVGKIPRKSKVTDNEFCQLCKILGGHSVNHTTEKCFFKAKMKEAWNKYKPKKSSHTSKR